MPSPAFHRAPLLGGEIPSEVAIAGDWDGDGTDGVGIFHPGSNTFYLRNDLTTGPAQLTVFLDPALGYPASAQPLAGDWDKDGVDEVGVYSAGTVYLRNQLSGGPPDHQYAVGGQRAVAIDFNGNGRDTIASFDPALNRFDIRNTHGGPIVHNVTIGAVDPGYWMWSPIAGAWQVPSSPVASAGYAWPTGAPGANGFNATAFEQALAASASVSEVLSVVVTRNDVLIDEAYHHGYDRHIAANVKSVSKSVLSALYGIAFRRGDFAGHEETVASYLPSYFQPPIAAQKLTITLGHLLTMRGGLQWSEGPNYIQPMLQSPDYTNYVVAQPIVSPPGTTYNYSTGLTHVASAALTQAAGVSTRDYARTHLFEPLGISVPRWDRSPESVFVGGAEMWLRPRDMARFGQLYLDGGTVGATTILNSHWVELSANPWIPEGGRRYGIWWRERTWSNYPFTDSYFAWGHGGQFIFLFPSWDLQIVVTSKWNVDQTASRSGLKRHLQLRQQSAAAHGRSLNETPERRQGDNKTCSL